jgi:nucleoside phosphorylase
VKRLPGSLIAEFNQQDGLHYFSGEWQTQYNAKLKVVACSAPRMGMTAASITALKAIERWRPKYLVMTGIAASTKTDLDYGDILVADSSYDYGSGKIATNSVGARIFIPTAYQIPMDPSMFALLQHWEQEQTSMEEIRRAWHPSRSQVPRMRLGVLASGAAVVQDKSLIENILAISRKTVGIDMEAYGIFHAAQLASAPRPKVLVVKSISDFGDDKKADDWQLYAAFTSSRFVYEFFTRCQELASLRE